MIFDLVGTPEQNAVITDALSKITFPWDRLLPGLQAQTGRSTIPVEWIDLSRWGSAAVEINGHPLQARAHSNGEEAHVIQSPPDELGRRAAWGLAWYSGKISIEQTLPSETAQETFVSEVAHIADFFYMTPKMREAIFDLYHGGDTEDHGHGWFEETGNNDYWSWVGESFMAGFTYAFAYPRIVPHSANWFEHKSTPEMSEKIRAILLPEENAVFGLVRSEVFHDAHVGIRRDIVWPSRDEAIAAGRRACGVCQP